MKTFVSRSGPRAVQPSWDVTINAPAKRSSGLGIACQRQQDPHLQAVWQDRLEADLAAVALDDLLDDRQPEPATAAGIGRARVFGAAMPGPLSSTLRQAWGPRRWTPTVTVAPAPA